MLHHTIEEAEKAIGKEFCAERAPSAEDTAAYQNAIDGMRDLARVAIASKLDFFKDWAHMPGREWSVAEAIIERLEAFRTEVRALLGEDYLLGTVLLHISSNHEVRPCAVSFNLYKANSADKAGFDIVIHANAASEEVLISRESKSALAAAGNQNVVHLDEFRETLTVLEAAV